MTQASESLLCRGMCDLLPDDMVRFRRIEKAFRDTCSSWGYHEVRTPTLEHLYLFTSIGTLAPQLLGRVYSFLDWDGWTGERVVLRPDATIPVARLYREALHSGTAKLSYVANIFRFNPGDESREVWQCGAELIGDTWPRGDLELVALATRTVAAAGVSDAHLVLSHMGIIRSLLERAGFLPEEQADLYDRLLDGNDAVLHDVELRLPELGPALRLLAGIREGAAPYLENLRSAFLPAVPEMERPLDELRLIERTAATLGLPTEVSTTGARDFEYYTGPVFRLVAGGTTLASGGRYDRLISDEHGNAVPACGFALHVDKLMPLCSPEADAEKPVLVVRPAHETPEALAAAMDVAAQLQQCGLVVSLVSGDPTCRWSLAVNAGDGTPYRLEDRETGRRVESPGIAEILAAMQEC